MKALLLALMIALTGCAGLVTPTTPLGKFTLDDATNASKLAKADGSPAALLRAKCYDYIAAQVNANANSQFVPGFLTLNELKFNAVSSATNLGSECGGVLPLVIAP